MVVIRGEGLTFDDVLLLPRSSLIRSRREVDISSRLTKRIKINVPIVSSPMDTVTESRLAIAMAREGAIGVIHRFMPIEDQVREVLKVKRSEGIIIEKPYVISPDNTIDDVRKMMEKYKVSGLLVVDESNHLLGIITSRDIIFEKSSKKVSEVMTPRKHLVTARPDVTIDEAKEILKSHKIEKLPLVDEKNILRGLITMRDIVSMEKFPYASKDKKGRLMVGAAVGLKDYLERTKRLLDAEVDFIIIDVANGYTQSVTEAIKKIKSNFDIDVVAGNVATAEGAELLVSAEADAIRVGIGSGSACITRLVAGVGVPQISAIMECAQVASKYDVPIISDGGIRKPGDIVKALAAGASTVMIGNLLAGTEESPGVTIIRENRKYKIFRGMASHGAYLSKLEREGIFEEEEVEAYVSEGVEGLVEYRGTVSEVLKQLVGGLRSGMSYLGAKNIKELQNNAMFIKITDAGIREGGVHDMLPF
ncbi:MAG: IMP dehydrogenase [Thermoprotei archaeon]